MVAMASFKRCLPCRHCGQDAAIAWRRRPDRRGDGAHEARAGAREQRGGGLQRRPFTEEPRRDLDDLGGADRGEK